MRENKDTRITGSKVVLVPYTRAHVERYHAWMQSEELRELTASEPLTLEQEYDMQRSWFDDDDKCTFIVLDRERYIENAENDVASMVGDVNLFFNVPDDRSTAELEIMIAEDSARGRGLGKEATVAMMKYGFDRLSVKRFVVKIGYNNETSIGMFRKLGFQEFSRSDVFQEVSMELRVSTETLVSLRPLVDCVDIKEK